MPENEPLVIEAKVSIRDIDSARVCASVLVRLTAFNHRILAPIRGRLVYLAADQQVDDRTASRTTPPAPSSIPRRWPAMPGRASIPACLRS